MASARYLGMPSESSQEQLVPFYPPLPVELIREVFEHIALTDESWAPSLALVLVSRDFYNWITPLIYHSVTLETHERALSFIRCIEAAQCRFVDNTRHIVNLAIHEEATRHCDWILSLCGNIQSLLLWPDKWCKSPHIADEGMELWPQPWHVVLSHRLETDWLMLRLPSFTHTTHLYLDEALDPQITSICLEMEMLTHICSRLFGDDDSELAVAGARLLLEKSSIKLVLVHAFVSGVPIRDFYGGIWRSLAEIPDERLFVMPGLVTGQLFQLFESGGTVWDSVDAWKDWRRAVLAEQPIFSEDA